MGAGNRDLFGLGDRSLELGEIRPSLKLTVQQGQSKPQARNRDSTTQLYGGDSGADGAGRDLGRKVCLGLETFRESQNPMGEND
jgi:hypothetical protein